MRFVLWIDLETSRISSIRFDVLGAPDLLATASAVSDAALGSTTRAASHLSPATVQARSPQGFPLEPVVVDRCLAALWAALKDKPVLP